jgi:hypothetical protein
MKQLIYILTILLAFSSCNYTTNKAKSKTEPKNKRLLAFKTSFIAELGDEKYDQLEKEGKIGKIETKYINDIIYVSYYEELNACGQYDGNIEIISDTIKLRLNLISDELCMSTSIEKLTFIIDNPGEKKKVIIK